jgi:hypothetical protein
VRRTVFCTVTAWALSVGLWSAPACAEAGGGETYALEWTREDGAESCPSRELLENLLQRMVGPVLGDRQRASLLVTGTVRRAEPPARWHAHIEVKDARGELVGERDLKDGSSECSTITPSLLLVLAFIIDPDSARHGLPESVAAELNLGETSGSSPGPLEPRAQSADRQKPDARTKPQAVVRPKQPAKAGQWYAKLAFAFGAEWVPEPSPGALVDLLYSPSESWGAGLSAAYWWPASVPVSGPRALADGVSFNAAHVSLSAYRRLFGSRRWQVNGAAGALLGLRWAQAEALAQRDDPIRAFFGPMLAVEGRWFFLPNWFVSAGASLAASAVRDRFVYQDYRGTTRELFSPGLLAAWGAAGLGARL